MNIYSFLDKNNITPLKRNNILISSFSFFPMTNKYSNNISEMKKNSDFYSKELNENNINIIQNYKKIFNKSNYSNNNIIISDSNNKECGKVIDNYIYNKNNSQPINIMSNYYNKKCLKNKITIKRNRNFNINFNIDNPIHNNTKCNNIDVNNNKNGNLNNKYKSSSDLQRKKNIIFSGITPEINNFNKETNNLIGINNKIYFKRTLSQNRANINYNNNQININTRNKSNFSSNRSRNNSFNSYSCNNRNNTNKNNNHRFNHYNIKSNKNNTHFDKSDWIQYYNETYFFDDFKDVKYNEVNRKKNSDDLYLLENYTTNQSSNDSTCSQKVKNMKRNLTNNKPNITLNKDNCEDFHFLMILSIQNGKKLEKKFK